MLDYLWNLGGGCFVMLILVLTSFIFIFVYGIPLLYIIIYDKYEDRKKRTKC